MATTRKRGTGSTVGDYAVIATTLYFAVKLSGPSAVFVLAAAIFHWAQGQPRVAFVGVYAAVAVAFKAFLDDGFNQYSGTVCTIVRVSLLCAVFLLVVLDRFLFPIGGRILKASGKHASAALLLSQKTDVVLRIHYPTKKTKDSDPIPYFFQGSAVVDGIGKFLRKPAFLFKWLVHTKPWAYEADIDTAPPVDTGSRAGYPIVLFSHGLGGTPDVYSCIINDLVSQGYLVAAVEHCDGSAAFTRLDDGFARMYEPLTDEERAQRSLEYKRRHRQLEDRIGEVISALDTVLDIAKPVTAVKVKASEKKGAADGKDAVPEEEEEALDLQLARTLLQGRIDTSRVVAMGHSFGAATALGAVEQDHRFTCCVMLDPWMFPLSAVTLCRGVSHVPVLSLTGEGFKKWKENDVAVRILLDKDTRAKYVRQKKEDTDAPNAKGKRNKDEDSEEGLDIVGSNGIAKDGTVSPLFFTHASATPIHPSSAALTITGLEHQNFNDFR